MLLICFPTFINTPHIQIHQILIFFAWSGLFFEFSSCWFNLYYLFLIFYFVYFVCWILIDFLVFCFFFLPSRPKKKPFLSFTDRAEKVVAKKKKRQHKRVIFANKKISCMRERERIFQEFNDWSPSIKQELCVQQSE